MARSHDPLHRRRGRRPVSRVSLSRPGSSYAIGEQRHGNAEIRVTEPVPPSPVAEQKSTSPPRVPAARSIPGKVNVRKPRPSRSVSTLVARTRRTVERVNSRVLADVKKNRIAFRVNLQCWCVRLGDFRLDGPAAVETDSHAHRRVKQGPPRGAENTYKTMCLMLGIRPAVENCTVKPLPFLILLILLLLLLPLVRAVFEPSRG
ncbi:hypothetical protein EYF80_048087 [Liparis tanakae]|uniref:Uncharacterized protein n=1 Tax=Liparis tanakae TaxID=230148 RepID=A0A4Z2FN54_9TELE|nr:hypothetical protein EYF80_048087 [Liparis tanakae]